MSKFRPLTLVLPVERIMKEAIRMVLESIYFRSSGRSCRHSALKLLKEEWSTSRWFLEFDIRRKSFHNIDRHRLISIFKEEIDDPKFFYPIQKLFSAGFSPHSVQHSVLLSALLSNIYLHKLDQEIGRIQHKYEIPLAHSFRSVLLRKEDSGEEEGSFNPNPNQDKRALRLKSIEIRPFHSLLSSSWHTLPTSTPGLRGDQKRPFVFPHSSSALTAFLNKPSSLL